MCFFVVAEEYRVKYLFRRPVIPFTFEFFVGRFRTAVTPSNSSTVTRNCCSNTVKYLVKPHWDVSSTYFCSVYSKWARIETIYFTVNSRPVPSTCPRICVYNKKSGNSRSKSFHSSPARVFCGTSRFFHRKSPQLS